MLALKKSDLKLGRMFSAPLFFDDQKTMFLPARMPVDEMALAVFDDWPVEKVFCSGRPLDFAGDFAPQAESAAALEAEPDLEEPAECEAVECESVGDFDEADLAKEAGDSFGGGEIKKSCDVQVSRMQRVFSDFSAKKYANLREEVRSIANDIFSVANYDVNFVLSAILYGKSDLNNLHRRAVNTAILTCLTAQTMSVSDALVIEYMQGALLHDVGMLPFVDALSKSEGSLSAEQFSRIKMHTMQAYQALRGEAGFSDEIAKIALCHHEQFDGGGYPGGLEKDQISEGVAIVAVADAFEALISSRPSRSSLMGAVAVKQIMVNSGKKFCPRVVEAFVRTVGIFPVGSFVLLNTQKKARIVAANRKIPMRPAINCEGALIDLSKERGIYIVRALTHEEAQGRFS